MAEELKRSIPLLPLRGLLVYPTMVLHLDVGRDKSVQALEQAMMHDHMIFLATQQDISIDEPGEDEIFTVGTYTKIKQMLKLASGERLSIYPRSDSRKRFCVRCDLHHVFRRCRYSVCGGPRCCFSRGAFTKRLAQSEHWPAGAYIGPCSHHHDKDAEHYGVQTRGLCDGHCKALNRKTN